MSNLKERLTFSVKLDKLSTQELINLCSKEKLLCKVKNELVSWAVKKGKVEELALMLNSNNIMVESKDNSNMVESKDNSNMVESNKDEMDIDIDKIMVESNKDEMDIDIDNNNNKDVEIDEQKAVAEVNNKINCYSLPTCLIGLIATFFNQLDHAKYLVCCRWFYVAAINTLSSLSLNLSLWQKISVLSNDRWKSITTLDLADIGDVEDLAEYSELKFPVLKNFSISNFSFNVLNAVIFDSNQLEELYVNWAVVGNDSDFEIFINLFKGGNIRKLSFEHVTGSNPYRWKFRQKIVAIDWKKKLSKLSVLLMAFVGDFLEDSIFDAVKNQLQYCYSRKYGATLSTMKNSSLSSIDVCSYKEMLQYYRNINLSQVTCMRFKGGFDVISGLQSKNFVHFLCNPSLRDIYFAGYKQCCMDALVDESIYRGKEMMVISIFMGKEKRWTENSYSFKNAVKLILHTLNQQSLRWMMKFNNMIVSKKLFEWLVDLCCSYLMQYVCRDWQGQDETKMLNCCISCKSGVDGWSRNYLWDKPTYVVQ